MQRLIDGVQKFRSGVFPNEKGLFEQLDAGQHPESLFITCSDSRIDPNLITQTRPGELFVLRTAGNIVPPWGAVSGGEAATIEYAVSVLKVKDIIVCGHSSCGAVGALLKGKGLESLPAVAAYLQHAEATKRIIQENYPSEQISDELVSVGIAENVLVQLDNLKTHPSVAAALSRGDVRLNGWVYRFQTGEIFAYNEDEDQFEPLDRGAARLASLSPRKRSLHAV